MPRRGRYDEDEDDRDYDRPRRRERDDRDYDDEEARPRSRRRYDDEDDRDDRPRRGAEPPSNGPAMTSMVLGIISFVGGVTAIPGLICGFVGLSKAKQLGGAGKGAAITGTVLSGVGLVVLGLTIWLLTWVFGDRQDRRISSNNLKQIGLAMHNSHDTNGDVSTGVARGPNDFNGRPVRESELSNKLSWRVEMLPFLEQSNIHRMLDLSERWDSGRNRPVADVVVSQYADTDARTDPDTRWRTFYGPGAPFDPTRPGRLTLTGITDGTSNTIFVAEAGDKVTWTRFNEIRFDENSPPMPSDFGRPGQSTFQVLMFDGSVRSLRKSTNPQSFKYAVMHRDGMPYSLDD